MNDSSGNYIRILVVIAAVAAIVAVAFLLGKKSKPVSRDGYYFDTYVQFTVYSVKDSKCLDECLNMCERYENLFSRTVEGSDIYRINNAGGESVSVDPETYYLLERALEFCEETDGAADITIAPLTDLWGFTHASFSGDGDAGNKTVIGNGQEANESGNPDYAVRTAKPSEEEINAALEKVNYENVILEGNNTVRLEGEGTQIDFGFIAKGYIADKLKEYLVSKNVKSAIISLGGNVVVIGTKPDGSEYNIGIKDPDNNGDIIENLKVTDKSIVTSGTYERFVEYDGIRYHHILDTSIGYPVDNGVKSVTILSDSSLEGDALSTICLILGEDNSKEILSKYGAEAAFH